MRLFIILFGVFITGGALLFKIMPGTVVGATFMAMKYLYTFYYFLKLLFFLAY